MFKKIAAGFVCLTLIAVGITSWQNHLFAEELSKTPGEVGTYQLVFDQDAGNNLKMYKINTTNGDTWIFKQVSGDYMAGKKPGSALYRWHPLPHGPRPE